MRLLGIDLAAEPKNTAACVLEWGDRPRVAALEVGRTLDNDRLVTLIGEADRTGIDAPLGWPVAFVAAVTSWQAGRGWPQPWEPDARRGLRLRRTDLAVRARGGPTPLSVSADSIGVCAMRAAVILDAALGPRADRVAGPAYEVYPAATLAALGIPRTGYKLDPDVRGGILDALQARFRLGVGEHAAELVRTDHALDALLSALSAAAAATGASVAPGPEEDPAVLATEGWVHVPVAGWPGD